MGILDSVDTAEKLGVGTSLNASPQEGQDWQALEDSDLAFRAFGARAVNLMVATITVYYSERSHAQDDISDAILDAARTTAFMVRH